jgi:hypothetical protein
VLAKFVVQDLEVSGTSSEAKVLYFACFGRGAPGFDTVEAIAKSLCVQLFQLLVDAMLQDGSVPDVKLPADLLAKLQVYLDSPEVFRNSSWRKDRQLFEDLIEGVPASEIYVVLDGLDECEQAGDDRRDFLMELATTYSATSTGRKRVKFFITSRPMEDDIETALQKATFEMVLKAHQSDIELVIRSMVVSSSPYRSVKCQEFLRRNQSHIISKLSNKAGNTYVWIRSIFWMLDVEKLPDLEWFDMLVEQLSPQLTKMYKGLVARIFEDDFSTQVLMLVVYGKELLSIADINAACCVRLGAQNNTVDDLNRRNKYLDESSTLSIVGTLVEVDSCSRLILIHQSVKDFFADQNPFEGHKSYPDPELFCFKLCCTFLMVQRPLDYYAIYEGDRSYYFRWNHDWPFYSYACTNWHNHIGCDGYTRINVELLPFLKRVLDTNDPHVRVWFAARHCVVHDAIPTRSLTPLYIALRISSKVIATLLLHGAGAHDLGFPSPMSDTILMIWHWPDLLPALLQVYKAKLEAAYAVELCHIASAIVTTREKLKAGGVSSDGQYAEFERLVYNRIYSLGVRSVNSDVLIGISSISLSLTRLLMEKLKVSDEPFSCLELLQFLDLFDCSGFGNVHLVTRVCPPQPFVITPAIVHLACAKQRSIYDFYRFLDRHGEVVIQPEAAKCIRQHYGLSVAAAICQHWSPRSKVMFSIVVEICNPSPYRCSHQSCLPFLATLNTTDLQPREVLHIFLPETKIRQSSMRPLFLR